MGCFIVRVQGYRHERNKWRTQHEWGNPIALCWTLFFIEHERKGWRGASSHSIGGESRCRWSLLVSYSCTLWSHLRKDASRIVAWCAAKNIANGHYTEAALLVYMSELSRHYASSTLWSIFSMLKRTVLAHNGCDLWSAAKIVAFTKRKSSTLHQKNPKHVRARTSIHTSKRQMTTSICISRLHCYVVFLVHVERANLQPCQSVALETTAAISWSRFQREKQDHAPLH